MVSAVAADGGKFSDLPVVANKSTSLSEGLDSISSLQQAKHIGIVVLKANAALPLRVFDTVCCESVRYGDLCDCLWPGWHSLVPPIFSPSQNHTKTQLPKTSELKATTKKSLSVKVEQYLDPREASSRCKRWVNRAAIRGTCCLRGFAATNTLVSDAFSYCCTVSEDDRGPQTLGLVPVGSVGRSKGSLAQVSSATITSTPPLSTNFEIHSLNELQQNDRVQS